MNKCQICSCEFDYEENRETNPISYGFDRAETVCPDCFARIQE